MISRRQVLAGALALAPTAALAARLPEAEARLSIATMATRTSTLGRVLSVWTRATEKQVDSRLDVSVVHDGGEFALDEADIVARIRRGRWDGAALTGVGLSMLAPSVAALGLPGRYADRDAVAKALAAGQQEFNKALAAAGFVSLGWGILGRERIFSRGIAVRGPSDLAGKPLWQPAGDAVTAAIIAATGATAVDFPQAALKSQLRKGLVALAASTASDALEHGWSAEVDSVIASPMRWSVSAVVVRKEALEGLPPDLANALLSTAPLAESALEERPDLVDEANFAELSKTLAVTPLSPEHEAQWKGVHEQVAAALVSGGTISQALLDSLKGA